MYDCEKKNPKVITLTGGPGGGKTLLLNKIIEDAELCSKVVVCEEAIHGMRFVRMDPHSYEFQCALVAIQAATEENLSRAFVGTNKRFIISHRGTLDPCAFWLSFGNSKESFFEMTGTSLEDHYRRYALVIHMESAAVHMPEAYEHYPAAHRSEDIAKALQLDRYLEDLWGNHSHYVKIEGTTHIEKKLLSGLTVIRDFLNASRK